MFYRAAAFEVKHTERDFYLATFARARENQGTPNWYPQEYVALFPCYSRAKVQDLSCDNWKAKHFQGRSW